MLVVFVVICDEAIPLSLTTLSLTNETTLLKFQLMCYLLHHLLIYCLLFLLMRRLSRWMKRNTTWPISHVLLARMFVYDPFPSNKVFAWLFVRLTPNISADSQTKRYHDHTHNSLYYFHLYYFYILLLLRLRWLFLADCYRVITSYILSTNTNRVTTWCWCEIT